MFQQTGRSKIKKLSHIATEYWTPDLSPDLYHSKSLTRALHCQERTSSALYCLLVHGSLVTLWSLSVGTHSGSPSRMSNFGLKNQVLSEISRRWLCIHSSPNPQRPLLSLNFNHIQFEMVYCDPRSLPCSVNTLKSGNKPYTSLRHSRSSIHRSRPIGDSPGVLLITMVVDLSQVY